MAFPYRRILSPIDFDENAVRAIAVASDLALSNDGEILLLHVVPFNRLHGGIPSTAETHREELAASKTKLAEIAHRYAGGARNELSFRQGDPVAAIIKAALDFDADLIVMATHGRKGLSHLLIGSVTEGVLRNAVCPVLVIRPAGPPNL
jgi:universal stress protein A